jgi:hypothetical protein
MKERSWTVNRGWSIPHSYNLQSPPRFGACLGWTQPGMEKKNPCLVFVVKSIMF